MQTQEHQLIDQIYRFGKYKRFLLWMQASVRLLLVLLLLWLSVALADDLFYFSTITRYGLWFLHAGVVLFLLYRYFFRPMLSWLRFDRRSDLSEDARDIGRKYPDVKDNLVNIYHLIQMPGGAYSTDLRDAAIKTHLNTFQSYRFHDCLKASQFLPNWKVVLPILIGGIAILGFKFNDIAHSTLRLLNPTNAYVRIPPFQFNIEPGNTQVLRGSSIRFKIDYAGPELEQCYVQVQYAGGANMRQLRAVENIKRNSQSTSYELQIKDLRQSLTYRVVGRPLGNEALQNQIKSDIYNISVKTPPVVQDLDIRLKPPLYSGLPEKRLDRNIGDIVALPGTRASVTFSSNKPLDSAMLKFASGREIPMNIRRDRVSADFTIKKQDRYQIALSDTGGLNNRNAITYQISLLPDHAPYVEITQPGHDVESGLDAKLPVKLEASDDFGFSSLALVYKFVRSSESAEDTTWKSLSLLSQSKRKKQIKETYVWDFNTLPLTFDDGIKYFARAGDNNNVTGPSMGKSETYYIRFPSLEEIFRESEQKQEEQLENLEDITKESKNLEKTLKELDREMKQKRETDWEAKERIKKSLKKQKELQKRADEIKKELRDVVKKLQEQNVISEDVLEKYTQLQELFREVATPEILEAMKKLQQTMESPNPKDMDKALSRFKMQQEQFRKNIERTMELLKQVQMEQKMDALVQKAQKLSEQQQKISERLKQKESQNPNADQLDKQVQEQKRMLENLERDMDDLLQEPRMGQFPQSNKTLDSARKQLSEDAIRDSLNRMGEEAKRNNQHKASQMSGNIQSQMNRLQSRLMQAQSQMQSQHKRKIQERMQNAVEDLLALSHEQEKLHEQTRQVSPYSDEFRALSSRQGNVVENYQKVIAQLVELSKQTFFINRNLSKSLGKALNNMHSSLDHLSERNKSAAGRGQQKAMQGLNESVLQLGRSLSQLAQAKSGTGFEQFMQKLQQMAGAQGQLNEQTMNLFKGQGNQGQLSLKQQREMQRLAGEQAALRDALQKMSSKMGDRQDVMGRMDQLAEEMDKVVQDMLKENVDRKTIERQQKILSRMLDAQQSMREREYSKKRMAERAKEYRTRDPLTLDNPYDRDNRELQEALQKALNEGYNTDYQRLIEAYFKQLMETETSVK